MPPKPWSTPDQDAFIATWFPEFLLKKSQKKLDGFWPKLKEAWFSEFPEETVLRLPLQDVSHDPNATTQPRILTPEERTRLDNAIAKRFKQLHDKLYNIYAKAAGQRGGISRSAHSLAGTLFKKYPKRRRRHQVLEVFAKEHKTDVQTALDAAGFAALNEAAMCRDDEGAWIDDNDPDIRKKRVEAARSDRMKLYRRVLQECFDAAAEEIQEDMRKKASEEMVRPKTTLPDTDEEGDVDRTPEEYQLSIDEALGVLEIFFTVFRQMLGGWVGFVSCIGPIPRLVSLTSLFTASHCFGRTKEGLTFEDYHTNFSKAVAHPLAKFARTVIPREVRLARALYSLEDEENLDEDLADAADQDTPAPTTPSKSQKKKAKRKAKKQKKGEADSNGVGKGKEKDTGGEQATGDPTLAGNTSGNSLPPPVRRPRNRSSQNSSSVSSRVTPDPFPSTQTSPPESFEASQSFDGTSTFSESVSSEPLAISDPLPYNNLSASQSLDATSAASAADIFPPGYDWTQHLVPDEDLGNFDVSSVGDDPFGMPPQSHDGYEGLDLRYPSFNDDDSSHGLYDGIGSGISDETLARGLPNSLLITDALLSDNRSSSSASAYTGTPSGFYLHSEADFHADASVAGFLPSNLEQLPEVDPRRTSQPPASFANHKTIDKLSSRYAIAPATLPAVSPVPIGNAGSSDSRLPSQTGGSLSGAPRPRPVNRTSSGPVEFGRTPQFRSLQSPTVGLFGRRSISAPQMRSSPLTQEPISGPGIRFTQHHLSSENANMPPAPNILSSFEPPPSSSTSFTYAAPTFPASQSSHSSVLDAASTPPPPSNRTDDSMSLPHASPPLENLPLRLRRMSTSPLPFPRSRPLANPPPPPPPNPPSPSAVALRMAAARQAKTKSKARPKRVVNAASSSSTSVKAGSASVSIAPSTSAPSSAAAPSASAPSSAAAPSASAPSLKIRLPARPTADSANAGPPAVQPPPTYVSTITNNNRRAAQEAAAKEKKAKEAAAAPKPGEIQVSYPAVNGYNAVVAPHIARFLQNVQAVATNPLQNISYSRCWPCLL
ncbi:hypothetical protein R3P38DRAFT_3236168 [Favolaschia claudopus]|uniref:Proteophosphoglycan ppg4 n=1 Tax=Favolaschia claudopus TaxID=2862362 RepID=A0AAV9ZD71_9AGAR